MAAFFEAGFFSESAAPAFLASSAFFLSSSFFFAAYFEMALDFSSSESLLNLEPWQTTPTSTDSALGVSSMASASAAMARLRAASYVMSSLNSLSSLSMTTDLPVPMQVALYATSAPLGSVSKRWVPTSSTPAMSSAVPNGRAPPYWV